MPDANADVTRLFEAVSSGDQTAWKKLFSVVYGELHRLAHGAMRSERPGQTLQTTALVHEAYLRLVSDPGARFENRAHFFGAAGTAMRRILVERARSRKTERRGAGRRPISLAVGNEPQGRADVIYDPLEDLELLDQVVDRLQENPAHRRKCSIVELRFFVGLTLREIAEALDVSLATVKRDWEFTRAWIRREMKRVVDHEA